MGYGTNLAKAERAIRETIEGDPRTDTSEEMFLQVNDWSESSVDFLVRAWVSADAYFAYQADMKRRVKEAFDAHGIDIPFPTRTLFMERAEPAPVHGASGASHESDVRDDEPRT